MQTHGNEKRTRQHRRLLVGLLHSGAPSRPTRRTSIRLARLLQSGQQNLHRDNVVDDGTWMPVQWCILPSTFSPPLPLPNSFPHLRLMHLVYAVAVQNLTKLKLMWRLLQILDRSVSVAENFTKIINSIIGVFFSAF